LKIKYKRQNGRLRSDSEWIYGFNPVLEALKAGRKIKTIFISSGRQDKIILIKKEAESGKIPVRIKEPVFFDITFRKGHQGVAAEVSCKEYVNLDELLKIPIEKNETAFFIIVDCLEDPRNLGALLRVADAAGVHGIVLQSHRSVTLSAEVAKVSAGAVEYVPVSLVANIKYAIDEMKNRGITIIGAEMNTEKTIWDIDLKVPIAIVVGSEGKGLRKIIRQKCDILAKIPMSGKINSLNVSVATGILSFEILRQRLIKN
jgi:23S rRNA (guanosine2251-2'-O)-methyltransferase